jgi:hypothetical protein
LQGLGGKVNTPLRALARVVTQVRSDVRTWTAICMIALVGFFGSNYFLQEVDGGTTRQNQVFEQWYSRATEASKKATKMALAAQEKLLAGQATSQSPAAKVPQSIVTRIRAVAETLDAIQSDLYSDVWKSLDTYPMVLDSYMPLFNSYTQLAFQSPAKGSPEELLASSLQYETDRFKRGSDGFKVSVATRNIRESERNFAEMSLAYDRILKAGSLYTGYDPVTSTEVFYAGIDDSRLNFVPPVLEQPRIRDEVLVTRGPDKGKIGQVIWLGRNGPESQEPDKVVSAVVKMDPNPNLGLDDIGKGVREVKAYPYSWIAVTRSSDQNIILDVSLGFAAAVFSCTLTYPLDVIKSRIQCGLPILPPGGVVGMFDGLTFNLLREAPNAAIYLASFNYLTAKFCLLVDANNPSLKFLVMVPAGIIGFVAGTPLRAPFELLNKQIQTGQAKTDQEAWDNVFNKPKPEEVVKTLQSTLFLCAVRGAPFGAFQCSLYEVFKDNWELVAIGFPLWSQPFIWGATAGAITGVITNPPDVLLSRLSKEDSEFRNGLRKAPNPDPLKRLAEAASEVQKEEGLQGFLKGAEARALYFAPEACLWFAAYESLKGFAGFIIAEF